MRPPAAVSSELDLVATQAILKFLPFFERRDFALGEWRGGEDDGSGVLQWPWFDYTPEVTAFIQALYDNGWVVAFDWPSWQPDAERIIASGLVDVADVHTLRRLLTLIVRKERFCDGFLASAFQEGVIVSILRRLDAIAASAIAPGR